MFIAACSDLHSHEIEVPKCDLLICAGDLTLDGNHRQLERFVEWLNEQPAKHKVFIAGNHDTYLERYPVLVKELLAKTRNIYYLEDKLLAISELNNLRIYGYPWTPRYGRWNFMLERGSDELTRKWSRLPDKLDILVTHGPPAGILDYSPRGQNVGDEDLGHFVKKTKPRYHIFGHIHYSHGILETEHTTYMNVAICDERLDPIHEATVFEYEKS